GRARRARCQPAGRTLRTYESGPPAAGAPTPSRWVSVRTSQRRSGRGAATMSRVVEDDCHDGGFLAGLEPQAAAELRRLGTRRRYPAGTTLFLEGDPAHEALVLLAGEVKVLVGSAEGREVILDVYEAGSLLGELSVIDGKP